MTIPFFSYPILSTFRLTPKPLYFLLTFLFQFSYFSCVFGRCLNDQRSLLLQLKNTLTYNSSLSMKLVYWNQNTDCCNWNGVECDRFGHVTALELDEETISGGIENSSPLYSFRYLENLNLAYNNFKDSQIPREIGNLTNLARVNLSYAEFGGQIPVELSQMTSLVMLDLSSYSYRLEYPNLKNFVQNLTKLEELYLDSVDFTHKGVWWEALSLGLPNLRSLSLSNCGLSGHLNSSFLQLRTLSVLRLDGNDLSGTALDIFANFRNLSVLSLRNCSLQGAFPTRILQVPTLQHLDLSSNNKLTGTMPEYLPGGSIRTLILGGTNFSGSLTYSIINLSNLSVIDISDCTFTGPIPSIIANLSKLIRLNFARNSFTGSVPIMSNKLEDIDLTNNDLNGSLSSKHFEGFSHLRRLDLSNNSLTGNIPATLFRLPSLQVLQLSNNKFSGQVNEFSTQNSNLMKINLRRNQLGGLIPKSFFMLKKLVILKLALNSFYGTIQLEDFQTLQNLEELNLGHNHLSVNITDVDSEFSPYPKLYNLNLASCNLYRFPNLRNQNNLRFLDLSNNSISGEIPSWIWEVGNRSLTSLNLSYNSLLNLQTPYQIPSSIYILDLHSNMLHGELPAVSQGLPFYVDYSSNHFQGHIPIDIGEFISNAASFSVANNSLSGEIPLSLCNAVNILLLDLSDNLLSGGLPPCLLQNVTTLVLLNIGRNNISGNIPDTFSVDCQLQTLDLSRNNLLGKIPASLARCKSLQVLNAATNNFNGTFPCFLMNSSSLHVLLLSSNEFFGGINCPGFNHKWPNLQVIDISFNSFTGVIDPELISSWTGMKFKNSLVSDTPLGFTSIVARNHKQDTLGGTIYYQDKATVTLKGLELEVDKILTEFTYIDFSSNEFHGAIPETFGEFRSLYVLNLSHNSFTGAIPKSFANLKNLESLDLSTNQLTGEIPTELSSLTFLSFFDVSYNKLIGSIPSGRQFSTFSAASYEGNSRLCGLPTNQSCNYYVPTETTIISTGKKSVNWMFMLVGLGYATGVALVVMPPLFSRRFGDRWEELQVKLLKLICPRYRD